MDDFDFINSFKKDGVVKNYVTHSSKIHATIINTVDNSIVPKLDNVGTFPILIYVRSGCFDFLHHCAPGDSNIITEKTTESKAIIVLADMGQPVEVMSLQPSLTKGKIQKLHHFL